MGKWKIYHPKAVITGVALFLLLVTAPFWLNMGKDPLSPAVVLSEKANAEQTCIRPKAFMRTRHMQLLNEWQTAVRNGNRIYVNTDGKRYTMSLSGACLSCHDNKADFCDRCHTYAGITPNCWDCHLAESKESP